MKIIASSFTYQSCRFALVQQSADASAACTISVSMPSDRFGWRMRMCTVAYNGRAYSCYRMTQQALISLDQV